MTIQAGVLKFSSSKISKFVPIWYAELFARKFIDFPSNVVVFVLTARIFGANVKCTFTQVFKTVCKETILHFGDQNKWPNC